ncbi:MAG: TIGR03621 family F420-dependent LLM class oxidoreductase [Acidobacteria bacterium]|nr:TIGR03621 family F420-dependent LLM class oxidoreductase [Acidobacteriota bacterium]
MQARLRINWIILKTSIEERFVYRADFAFATFVRFLPIVTQIFLWTAVYSAVKSGEIEGYSVEDIIAYYLLTMLARAFSSMPGLASGIGRQVRDGEIKKFLIQPIDLVGFLFLARIAHKLVYYVVAAAPFALVYYVCRDYFPGWPEREVFAAFLLSLVLANDYRHPAVLAKEIATLDLISDGRVELGIGAGWMASDYATAGIDMDTPSVRIERLEESLHILRRLFAGEVVDFVGEHYRIAGLAGRPMPTQGARLPIMVAGGRQKILSVAGRHADIVGLNPALGAGVIDHRAGPSATAEATDEKIGWIRAAAGERSDDIELHTRIHVAVITDDRESVAEAMAPSLGVTPEAALESPHAVAGTVDQCVETILGWRARWGISYIGFSADVVEDFAPVVTKLKTLE